MKRSTAILSLLGLGAAALAVLGVKARELKKMEEEKEPLESCPEEEIKAIEAALEEEMVTTVPEKENIKKTDTVMPLSCCFYTTNGVVWHADRDCYYIKTAAEIYSGSLESAKMAGKLRPCANCCAAHSAE